MSVCPNQIKVKHPYVLVHQGKKNSTYIQMFPKTIPVSGYQSDIYSAIARIDAQQAKVRVCDGRVCGRVVFTICYASCP